MANYDIGTATGATNTQIATAIKGVVDSGLDSDGIASALTTGGSSSGSTAVMGIVYASDFGCSTSATDNTQAINDAIESVYATYGAGVVQLDAGTFYFSGGIKLRSRVHLVGVGSAMTKLKLITGSNVNGVELYDDTTVRIGLRGLELQGDYWDSGASTSSRGGSFENSYTTFGSEDNGNYKFSDVIFSQWATTGLAVRSTATQACVSCYFEDVYSRNNGALGFDLRACTDGVFIRLISASNGSAGFYGTSQHSNCKYIACKSFYNGRSTSNSNGRGFNIAYCENITFIACEAQENYAEGVLLTGCERTFGDIVVDANGSEASPNTGVILVDCSMFNLSITSASMHTPTWQSTAVSMTNCSGYTMNLINDETLVTTSLTESGTNTGLMIINGVIQS